MEDMARIAYLSPFHFNRIFHQITGLPPTQFLYAMRIEAAKRLLLTSRMSITNICYEVGYNSLGTFTTRFTEYVGLSPSKFRNLAQQINSYDWDRIYREGLDLMRGQSAEPYLCGKVHTSEDFKGLIFVGLFEETIPRSRPIAGTLLTHTSSFKFGPVPEGNHYLLVAALPQADDPQEYLLLDFSKILVGVEEVSLPAGNHHAINIKDIHLRPIQITDPPILVALPGLLADSLKRTTLDEQC
jgi:AraC-like DNA-binding protein